MFRYKFVFSNVLCDNTYCFIHLHSLTVFIMRSYLHSGPARSLRAGGLTEVTAMTPVKPGRIPDERRTYEKRLRFAIERIQKKHEAGLPSELSLIHSLHYGSITIIRPNQYHAASMTGHRLPPDDYVEADHETDAADDPEKYRTWVLTKVVFDGDVKAYFRDIAVLLNSKFDKIYQNCEGYPGTERYEDFWAWIMRHQLGTDLLYVANSGYSVAEVQRLADFKRRFDVFVSKVRPADGSVPDCMDELFDEFLRDSLQYPDGFPAFGGVYIRSI